MGRDGVWRRIRWDNVGRLAALVALVLLVVAWPRLSGGAPRLPPATAVPVAVPPAASGGVGRAKRRAAGERRRRAERRARAARRVRAKRRERAERQAGAERRARAEREAAAEQQAAERRPPAEPDAQAAPETTTKARPRPKRRRPGPASDPAVDEFGLP